MSKHTLEGEAFRWGKEIEFVNELPKTSKEDKGSHGFGVRSIKAMVEKYGGSIHIETEDGIFTLTILLPLP